MKTAFLSIVCAFFCGFAYSQTHDAWKVVEIKDTDSTVAGYIYHTYAVGRKIIGDKTEKSITGLRMVCTAAGTTDPIIAIFWDNIQAESSVTPTILFDGKAFTGNEKEWKQDGNLTYRSITESPNFMKAMGESKTIQVSWKNSAGKKYITSFDLSKYSSNLNFFYSQCGNRT